MKYRKRHILYYGDLPVAVYSIHNDEGVIQINYFGSHNEEHEKVILGNRSFKSIVRTYHNIETFFEIW